MTQDSSSPASHPPAPDEPSRREIPSRWYLLLAAFAFIGLTLVSSYFGSRRQEDDEDRQPAPPAAGLRRNFSFLSEEPRAEGSRRAEPPGSEYEIHELPSPPVFQPSPFLPDARPKNSPPLPREPAAHQDKRWRSSAVVFSRPATASLAEEELETLRDEIQPLSGESLRVMSLQEPRMILEGTVLTAYLETAGNSDHPGAVRAIVNRDVWDTLSGQHLLVPRGSRLFGRLERASKEHLKASIFWHRLVTPSGLSLTFPDVPGSDLSGGAGVPGRRKAHSWKAFGAALLTGLSGAALQLSQPPPGLEQRTYAPEQTAVGAATDSLTADLEAYVTEVLERPPTITVIPGTEITVLVNRDVVFPDSSTFQKAPGGLLHVSRHP